MGFLSGVSSFFGLDIGSTALRAVELKGVGVGKSLYKYAYMPISVYISNNTPISIMYGVTGATPTADKVHYVIERMY